MSKPSSILSNGALSGTRNLLFLHDSVGAQLLSSVGEANAVAGTHPNGGGLRHALETNGYRVHSARTLPRAGDHVPIFGWLPAFRDRMKEILRLGSDGAQLPVEATNRIVLFKSCFTYNWFAGPGDEPGDPNGPALTEANVRAMYRALLPVFRAEPDVLFVALTTPPLPPLLPDEPRHKRILKRILGWPSPAERLLDSSAAARRFAGWLASHDGWLSGYDRPNVAVFDLFDALTDGVSDVARFPTKGGYDAHPSAEGNARVTAALVPFLNREARYAGLDASDSCADASSTANG